MRLNNAIHFGPDVVPVSEPSTATVQYTCMLCSVPARGGDYEATCLTETKLQQSQLWSDFILERSDSNPIIKENQGRNLAL